MNKSHSASKDYILNMIAGLINASESVFLSILVTRITGIMDAGILIIGFAICNLFVNVGKYGMRPFQVTDIHKEFSTCDYFISRIVTTMIMLAACAGYILYGIYCLSYSRHKAICIVILMLIFATESIEDVFGGFFQNVGYLYIGALIFSFRWVSIYICFLYAILISHNMELALILSFAVSLTIFVSGTLIALQKTDRLRIFKFKSNVKNRISSVKKLLFTTFPLFATSFMHFFISNSAKYALDIYANDEVQACYGFVSMPVFCVSLLASFIYQPILVELARCWNDGEYDVLIKKISRQMIYIIFMTIIAEAMAYFLGIPVLSWLYHTNLDTYKEELLILIFSSGFVATANFLGVMLNMMRKQKQQMIVYFAASMLAAIIMRPSAKYYGTIGVSLSFLLIISIISVNYYYLIKNRFSSASQRKL